MRDERLQERARLRAARGSSSSSRRRRGVCMQLCSSSAATPGSVLPSRNSSDAPPPVETWLIVASSPICSTAAAESPPPTIVVAPRAVASAIASATARVPASNGGVSNTPIGPFQTTVLAPAIASRERRRRLPGRCRTSPRPPESRRAPPRARLRRVERRRHERVLRAAGACRRARASSAFAIVDAVGLDERLARLEPHRLEERARHRAADDQPIHLRAAAAR